MEFNLPPSKYYHPGNIARERVSNAVYDLFVNYFGDMSFTKINDYVAPTGGAFSVYRTRIHCLMCNGYRYCVIFAPLDRIQVGDDAKLSDINWKSFQTCFSENFINCTESSYNKNQLSSPLTKIKLNVTKRTKDKTYYSCNEIPIKVELLSKPSSGRLTYENFDTNYDYPDMVNLMIALETYQCVVIIG